MLSYSSPNHQHVESTGIVISPMQLPVHALYASRHVYANYPEFQRQEVWPDQYKADYIDSLINKIPVPEIWLTNAEDHRGGSFVKFWALDGQQRMQTLMQFLEAHEAIKKGKPIPRNEQGRPCFYFPMTPEQEEKLLNAVVRFAVLVGLTKETRSKIFMRLQNQVSLKLAEKLWSSPTQFRDIAAGVYRHPFIKQIYKGKTIHYQAFQMSAYPLVIEMYKPFAELSGTRLRELAEKHSNLVNAPMEGVINRNLDHAMRIYDGLETANIASMIIVYQSLWLLNFIGVNLDVIPKGVLTPWFSGLASNFEKDAKRGAAGLYSQIRNTKVQKLMWQRWLEEIVYGGFFPLGDENQKRDIEAQLQRVVGWLKNNGICLKCKSSHVQLKDVRKHVFRATDMRSSEIICHLSTSRSVPMPLLAGKK